MKSLIKFGIVFYSCLLFSCSANDDISGNGKNGEALDPRGTPAEPLPHSDSGIIRKKGNTLIDSLGQPVYLQGVAFGNEIWSHSKTEPVNHHSEIDYQRVKDMGMNVIRFYLNYHLFEDDNRPYEYRQEGWNWLDKNIAWARKYGIYLILNMHAPQGGYQSQGKGDALWTDPENQNRLAALWKAIAKRYANEGIIAGFGPVNEPVPTSSIGQWSMLAQKILDAIRTVNTSHLVFIENAIYVKGNFEMDQNLNFPQVTGKNIVYEFHGYFPHRFTHQLMEFTQLPDGGAYPDEDRIEVAGDASEWYTTTYQNPGIDPETANWKFYEGIKFRIDDPKISFLQPTLAGEYTNKGTLFFDDISVKEYNEKGVFTRNIHTTSFDDAKPWFFWSRNKDGTGGITESNGRTDTFSAYISSTTDIANLGESSMLFVPIQNYSYQISGWMMGKNLSERTNGKIRLDAYTVEGKLYRRNKEYLQYEMKKYVDWASKNNAILYMGEFGTGYPSFQENKGGIQYVKDMLDLAREFGIHFTYHTYHEDNFGLYRGWQQPDPSNVNQALIDLFTEELKN